MQRIAGRGNARLCQHHLIIAHAQVAKRIAAGDHSPERRRGDLAGRNWQLDDRPNQGFVQAEAGHRTNHAFASYRRGFNGLAVPHHREQ